MLRNKSVVLILCISASHCSFMMGMDRDLWSFFKINYKFEINCFRSISSNHHDSSNESYENGATKITQRAPCLLVTDAILRKMCFSPTNLADIIRYIYFKYVCSTQSHMQMLAMIRMKISWRILAKWDIPKLLWRLHWYVSLDG